MNHQETANHLSSLGDKIRIVADITEKNNILENISPGKLAAPLTLGFVNAHAVNLCHRNPQFFEDLSACDLLLRDGSGMKIFYRLNGREAGLNLNGTDFIPEILTRYAGHHIALMGTQNPYLSAAAKEIEAKGGHVVATIDGFQPEETYIKTAQEMRPALIILAMGMPRQEAVARKLGTGLEHPCLIVCGGAILDFLGGKVTRAPYVFRRFGMEWAYRLLMEPKRLFTRYVVGNGVFLARVLRVCAAEFRNRT